MKRITFTLDAATGEWGLPCGCKSHYFDGKPLIGTVGEETGLVGKLAPHLHLCEKHGAMWEEAGRG